MNLNKNFEYQNIKFYETINDCMLLEEISLSKWKIALLAFYMEQILEINSKINLTSIKNYNEFASKHIADSIKPFFCKEIMEKNGIKDIFGYIKSVDDCLMSICPDGRIVRKTDDSKKHIKILDIGTGAGFPLFPISVGFAEKNISFSGIDSVNKKLDAVRQALEKYTSNFINLYHGRFEDLGRMKLHREESDIVVSRAVAPLNILLEYSAPFVKQGGFFVAYKSGNADCELNSSETISQILGLELVSSIFYTLNSSNSSRSLIVYRKARRISNRFPRKVGLARKAPLV